MVFGLSGVMPSGVLSVYCKAATGWSVFASGVDLGRSRVLSGPPIAVNYYIILYCRPLYHVF